MLTWIKLSFGDKSCHAVNMDSYYILKEQSMKTCTYITDQSTNVHTKLSLRLGVNALFRL